MLKALIFIVISVICYFLIRYLFSRAMPQVVNKVKLPATVEGNAVAVEGQTHGLTMHGRVRVSPTLPERTPTTMLDVTGYSWNKSRRVMGVAVLGEKLSWTLGIDKDDERIERICKLIDDNLNNPDFINPIDFDSGDGLFYGHTYLWPSTDDRNGRIIVSITYRKHQLWDSNIHTVYLTPKYLQPWNGK